MAKSERNSKQKTKGQSTSSSGAAFVVCTGGKICEKHDGRAIYRALKKRLAKTTACPVEKSNCLKHCRFSPVMVAPGGEILGEVDKSDVKTIVKRYLKEKKPPERLRLKSLK